ncbi:uncharacterized protein LOC114527502 isoform X2 [Dendronephthya gigantea]|uniref:uncharacterized protein LOC114527502 isoform X2 n=1 Tax=Dendronephthya gigantea TaxID=151771 RepID=UPI00106CF5F7|nr:uncharacterized protein LOC114527502 isoform X2 [Dendronephthya gigantea]
MSGKPLEKKKFQAFLGEILRTGCLKGFKYFALTLRGREELICRVLNEPMSPEVLQYYRSPASAKMKSGSSSFTFDKPENVPRNSESLLLSQNSQLERYGNYGDLMDVGLPPASPSEKDVDVQDNKSTLFLIAAYARYNYPYVWIRSNHQRIVQLTGKSEAEIEQQKDSPLKLKSTENWRKKGTKLWEIIAEVVHMCMFPSPLNPFAVDHRYFDSLPLAERIIATGAIANFLQEILADGNHPYNARVFDDLHEITRRHFRDLHTIALNKLEEERLRAYEEQRRRDAQSRMKHLNRPYISVYPQFPYQGY